MDRVVGGKLWKIDGNIRIFPLNGRESIFNCWGTSFPCGLGGGGSEYQRAQEECSSTCTICWTIFMPIYPLLPAPFSTCSRVIDVCPKINWKRVQFQPRRGASDAVMQINCVTLIQINTSSSSPSCHHPAEPQQQENSHPEYFTWKAASLLDSQLPTYIRVRYLEIFCI